jgi:hypothetical protein
MKSTISSRIVVLLWLGTVCVRNEHEFHQDKGAIGQADTAGGDVLDSAVQKSSVAGVDGDRSTALITEPAGGAGSVGL